MNQMRKLKLGLTKMFRKTKRELAARSRDAESKSRRNHDAIKAQRDYQNSKNRREETT